MNLYDKFLPRTTLPACSRVRTGPRVCAPTTATPPPRPPPPSPPTGTASPTCRTSPSLATTGGGWRCEKPDTGSDTLSSFSGDTETGTSLENCCQVCQGATHVDFDPQDGTCYCNTSSAGDTPCLIQSEGYTADTCTT